MKRISLLLTGSFLLQEQRQVMEPFFKCKKLINTCVSADGFQEFWIHMFLLLKICSFEII